MSTMWRTRPETAGDIGPVREVHLAAFPTSEEADLVDALRTDEAWLPGLSWVAEAPAPGVVVAHGLLTRCLVDGIPALALAPVAVLPEQQRRGAGGAVIRSLLATARARGELVVVVLGHPKYYPRFGFVPASRYGIRAPFEVADEALMVMPLRPGVRVPGGPIRYAAPFGM